MNEASVTDAMIEPIKEIDRKEPINSQQAFDRCGAVAHKFPSEKVYTDWLVANHHVVMEVLGLTGDAEPVVNSALPGDVKARPDLILKTADTWHIVEVKLTHPTRISHAVSHQFNGIGQLLRYQNLIKMPSKLYLMDAVISQELLAVVQNNRLPITLIEFNPDYVLKVPAVTVQ
jgi:hypothetical protein